MKILVFILSIYVLALSGIPCLDKDDDGNDKPSTEQKDYCCSPFFACSTCVGFTLQTTVFELIPQITFQKKQFTIYTPSSRTEFHCSIWQPPKIS